MWPRAKRLHNTCFRQGCTAAIDHLRCLVEAAAPQALQHIARAARLQPSCPAAAPAWAPAGPASAPASSSAAASAAPRAARPGTSLPLSQQLQALPPCVGCVHPTLAAILEAEQLAAAIWRRYGHQVREQPCRYSDRVPGPYLFAHLVWQLGLADLAASMLPETQVGRPETSPGACAASPEAFTAVRLLD